MKAETRKQKLEREANGILAWLIDSLKRWKAEACQ